MLRLDFMNREQLVRQKKKEHAEWLDANMDNMLEFSKSRGYSDELTATAIQEVFDEDLREIVSGKRSK